MKRKSGILLFSVSLLALGCISLSACNDDDTKKDKDTGAPSVSLHGLDAYYTPSDTINWENVSLTVTYHDGEVNELTNGLFDVEPSQLTSIQEFVLDTSGLYTNSKNQNAIPEGSYDISYYVRSNDLEDETIYTGYLTTVNVTEYPADIYEVESFSEPSFLTTYKRNLERVNDSEDAGENEFYEAPSAYTVGDDNPFKFHPTLELSLIDSPSSGYITPESYAVDVSVTYNHQTLDLEDNDYVSYDNFEFSFTEKAIGNTFTLSVSPKYFTADWAGYKIDPVELTVLVEDGWNAYSALDLGRINLVDPEFKYEKYVEYYQSPYALFWSQDDTGASVYSKKVYHEIWEEFLTSKGETDLELISGIYLHNDIVITNDDIPEDFIITEAEASARSANYDDMVGSIRDGVIIYNHLMENNFTLNGNLFDIDSSNLKWGMTRETFSNDDPLNYLAENNPSVSEGNSVLFCFDDAVTNTYFSELPNGGSGFFTRPDDWPVYTAEIKNLETQGNKNRASGETKDNDSELASGCLTFLKSTGANTVVNNSIIKEYLVAGYAEKTEANAEYYCLDMNHLKVFDCYGCAFVVWCSGKSVIDNSVVKRLGGPIVLIESAKASVESGEDGYNPGFQMSGFEIGSSVTIENPLGGDEAWFQIYDLSSYMAVLKDMIDPLFTGGKFLSLYDVDGLGKSLFNEDGKFSLVVAGMDRYITKEYDLYIDFGYESEDFKYDADYELDESSLDPNNLSYNDVVSLFYADDEIYHGYSGLLDYFPVFMTNTGRIFSLAMEGSTLWGIFVPTSIYLFDVGEYYKDKLSNPDATLTQADYKMSDLGEEDNFVYFYLNYSGIILTLGFELYDYEAPAEDPE